VKEASGITWKVYASKDLSKAVGEKRGRIYEIVEVEGNAVSKG
jgi:hypothetical protein